MNNPRSRYILRICLLTGLYFLAGRLGLHLALVNPSASAIWPPTGIALAAFLIFGEQVWPAILLGAFLVNFTTTTAVPPSLAIAAGNTAEGLIGAYLVKKFAGDINAFERSQDVLKFAVLAGLLGTAVSATAGVAALIASGLAARPEFSTIWFTWWLGDVAGALIVAPVLLIWSRPPDSKFHTASMIEAVFLFSSVIVVCLLIFSNISTFGSEHYPVEFIIAPWIIWAAFRFGQRGTSAMTTAISVIAIYGTLHAAGPFARANPNVSLLLLQSFMATVTISALVLSALVSERRNIEGALRGSNNKLLLSVEELEKHNSKMLLLNEMGDLLQSCLTLDEAYSIIGQLGERLFQPESGALLMIDSNAIMVETAVVWGANPPERGTFTLDQCWALRRGRIHLLNESGLELPCPHYKSRNVEAAVCIPLTAHGETIGVLHLESTPPVARESDHRESGLLAIQIQLAEAMAATAGLALANLKLRTSLLHLSVRDPLTELFNRRYLEETLEREISRATRLKRSVAVIMLDIDHFKNYNDTFGHAAGDALLRELGRFLKKQIRGGDFACRYGGEEFALIFPEVTLKDINLRTQKLLEDYKNLSVHSDGAVVDAPTLSLGVAVYPEHGSTGKELLRAADAALYEAKHKGRDQVAVALSREEEIQE